MAESDGLGSSRHGPGFIYASQSRFLRPAGAALKRMRGLRFTDKYVRGGYASMRSDSTANSPYVLPGVLVAILKEFSMSSGLVVDPAMMPECDVRAGRPASWKGTVRRCYCDHDGAWTASLTSNSPYASESCLRAVQVGSKVVLSGYRHSNKKQVRRQMMKVPGKRWALTHFRLPSRLHVPT